MRKYFIKLLFTAVAILVLVKIIGGHKFLDSMHSINMARFITAFAFFPAVIAAGSIKWKLIIEHEAKGLSLTDSIVSFLGGAAMGLLTPGRVGELGRVAFIRQGRRGALAGIALVDRMIDVEVTLALGIIGSHMLLGYPLTYLIIGLVLSGAYFIFYPRLSLDILNRVLRKTKLGSHVDAVTTGIMTIKKTTLLKCFFFRMLASTIDVFQFYLLCSSFLPLRFMEAVAVYPTLILSNLLPLTVGGVGIRESISILALARFGVSSAASASASFLLFCINSLVPALLGMFFLNRVQMKRRRSGAEGV